MIVLGEYRYQRAPNGIYLVWDRRIVICNDVVPLSETGTLDLPKIWQFIDTGNG